MLSFFVHLYALVRIKICTVFLRLEATRAPSTSHAVSELDRNSCCESSNMGPPRLGPLDASVVYAPAAAIHIVSASKPTGVDLKMISL